jgi:hypothetical protein
MSSGSRYGYAARMSAAVFPAASSPTMVPTVIRNSRTHGRPPITWGSCVILASASTSEDYHETPRGAGHGGARDGTRPRVHGGRRLGRPQCSRDRITDHARAPDGRIENGGVDGTRRRVHGAGALAGAVQPAPSPGRCSCARLGASRIAGWTGLEPAASGVTGRRYNQLNYHPRKSWCALGRMFISFAVLLSLASSRSPSFSRSPSRFPLPDSATIFNRR